MLLEVEATLQLKSKNIDPSCLTGARKFPMIESSIRFQLVLRKMVGLAIAEFQGAIVR